MGGLKNKVQDTRCFDLFWRASFQFQLKSCQLFSIHLDLTSSIQDFEDPSKQMQKIAFLHHLLIYTLKGIFASINVISFSTIYLITTYQNKLRLNEVSFFSYLRVSDKFIKAFSVIRQLVQKNEK